MRLIQLISLVEPPTGTHKSVCLSVCLHTMLTRMLANHNLFSTFCQRFRNNSFDKKRNCNRTGTLCKRGTESLFSPPFSSPLSPSFSAIATASSKRGIWLWHSGELWPHLCTFPPTSGMSDSHSPAPKRHRRRATLVTQERQLAHRCRWASLVPLVPAFCFCFFWMGAATLALLSLAVYLCFSSFSKSNTGCVNLYNSQAADSLGKAFNRAEENIGWTGYLYLLTKTKSLFLSF